MISGLSPKHNRKNPSNLIIGRLPQDVVNNSFTIDLKNIIHSNWDNFSSLFESNKPRFEMNMDTINKARQIDSHAKPIKGSEIDDFNNSYHWMLNRLANIPMS